MNKNAKIDSMVLFYINGDTDIDVRLGLFKGDHISDSHGEKHMLYQVKNWWIPKNVIEEILVIKRKNFVKTRGV